jgi:hypothetical protein
MGLVADNLLSNFEWTRNSLTLASGFKLFSVLILVFSFAVSPLPLRSLSNFLPSIPKAHANSAPVEPWYPAGPSMDTLVYKTYVDEHTEFNGLQNGEIDIDDWPLTTPQISTLTPDPNFFVTAPISYTGYFELQFNLAANFWGCNMSFGNSVCGRDIRQAFAHSLDKTVFTSPPLSVPIDNPVPPSVDLVLPNPCGWDATHVETGPNCVVGENGLTGGVAYHLNTASQDGGAGTSFAWTPSLGSPDFCAAADHLIAAGLASGRDPTTCVLTGVSATVAANPVSFYIRSDISPTLQGGQSVAQFICGLLTGSYTTGCTSAGLTLVVGPGGNFPGFYTSTTTISQSWHVYTAFIHNILTFDGSLYFIYDSRFVSGIPGIKPPNGPCSVDAFASFAAPNYMYLCDQTYDSLITEAEFSPCLRAPGDPTDGLCSNGQLSATSASNLAQDEFGKNAFTIPWFSETSRFGYRSNWSRVVLHMGDGFTPPGNIPAEFNAYSASPTQAGTIRQGFKEGPTSANPFTAVTPWDSGLQGNIWDRPNQANPASPQSLLDWMTTRTDIISNTQLGYPPPSGTVLTYRYNFRNDIFWHTGQKMTAWDAAFSYIAFKTTGVAAGAGLAPMVGVKVLSTSQMDVNLNAVGPFTQLYLSTLILPGRFWSTCSAPTWDAGAANPNFAVANAALTPCIGPNTTGSGVILPTATAVDSSKIRPTYDPIASGTFVGSGPWVCKSPGGVIGSACSSSGTQIVPPGGNITLQRYGFGSSPGGSLNAYFRSSGGLALWTWSGNTGDFNRDFLNFSALSSCFGQPIDPYLKLADSNGNNVWDPGETVVYETNRNGKYDSLDTIVSGPIPSLGTVLLADPHIRFVDSNSNGAWDLGETVVSDNFGLYTSFDTVIAGPIPALRTLLQTHFLILFLDSNTNGVWDSGETVIFDAGTNRGVYDTSDTVIAGMTPSLGAVLTRDPSIKFVDSDSNGTWSPGETVVYDVNIQGRYDLGDTVITGAVPAVGKLLTLGSNGCGHWQQGIGAPAGQGQVGLIQVGIAQRFVGVNWVSPYNWISSPPQGIASYAPVLYEGSATLNPSSIANCVNVYPIAGYDC